MNGNTNKPEEPFGCPYCHKPLTEDEESNLTPYAPVSGVYPVEFVKIGIVMCDDCKKNVEEMEHPYLTDIPQDLWDEIIGIVEAAWSQGIKIGRSQAGYMK